MAKNSPQCFFFHCTSAKAADTQWGTFISVCEKFYGAKSVLLTRTNFGQNSKIVRAFSCSNTPQEFILASVLALPPETIVIIECTMQEIDYYTSNGLQGTVVITEGIVSIKRNLDTMLMFVHPNFRLEYGASCQPPPVVKEPLILDSRCNADENNPFSYKKVMEKEPAESIEPDLPEPADDLFMQEEPLERVQPVEVQPLEQSSEPAPLPERRGRSLFDFDLDEFLGDAQEVEYVDPGYKSDEEIPETSEFHGLFAGTAMAKRSRKEKMENLIEQISRTMSHLERLRRIGDQEWENSRMRPNRSSSRRRQVRLPEDYWYCCHSAREELDYGLNPFARNLKDFHRDYDDK